MDHKRAQLNRLLTTCWLAFIFSAFIFDSLSAQSMIRNGWRALRQSGHAQAYKQNLRQMGKSIEEFHGRVRIGQNPWFGIMADTLRENSGLSSSMRGAILGSQRSGKNYSRFLMKYTKAADLEFVGRFGAEKFDPSGIFRSSQEYKSVMYDVISRGAERRGFGPVSELMGTVDQPVIDDFARRGQLFFDEGFALDRTNVAWGREGHGSYIHALSALHMQEYVDRRLGAGSFLKYYKEQGARNWLGVHEITPLFSPTPKDDLLGYHVLGLINPGFR